MKRTCMKQTLIVTAMVGTIVIPGNVLKVDAADSVVSSGTGIKSVLKSDYMTDAKQSMKRYLVPNEQGEYLNRAFVKIGEDFVYVRNAPDTESSWTGKLYQNNAVAILASQDDWVKIESGTVTGYVPINDLITGDDAKEYAETQAVQKATVTADVLNVRSGQSTEADILTQITMNQQYEVTGDPVDGWYPIQVGDIAGWSSGEYLNISPGLTYGESKEEEEQRLAKEAAEKQAAEDAAREAEEARKAQEAQAAAEAAAMQTQAGKGQAVVDYACQFIGNPYVWGGTSLTEGCDCSGFVQSVYANFGVALPRTTWDMENVGTEVSYENAQQGDLILYDGHVGLYMGDGTIVNAIDSANGIGVSNATGMSIITIRRVL